LIEFRILPHTETLIRNCILKLGNEWSYTVICGNDNYDFLTELCKQIHPEIKVIKLDITNADQNVYNNLLLTKDFWNMLFGEKY
jgi:hypothetical protein